MEPDSDPARHAAQYRAEREAERERAEQGLPAPEPGPDDDEAPRPRYSAAPGDRQRFIDTVIDQAMRRGEFDDLPLAGKPIPGLRGTHDPDWWLKNLVEREQITGVLPAAQLRREHAELDETLDRQSSPDEVREIVEDFNARVVDARRQLLGGPPVLTPTRDVELEVRRWQERRQERLSAPSRPDRPAASRTADGTAEGATDERRPRRWWRRRG